MTNLIFIGRTYYHTSTSHGHSNAPPMALLLIFLILFYLIYAAFVCMARGFGYFKRKQFIIYLLIPFSWWFMNILELFKED